MPIKPNLIQSLKSEYSKNIITLSSGTAISGLIPVIGSLFIMKLYTPEDYGLLAMYMAIYAVLSVVSTGRYELSIVIPKEDDEAASLTHLSISISFVFNLLVLGVLLFLDLIGLEIESLNKLGIWKYALPMSSFFLGSFNALFYWQNRTSKYKRMAFSRIANNAFTTGFQLLGAWFNPAFSTLIFGRIVGRFSSLIVLLQNPPKMSTSWIQSMIDAGRRYAKFPLHLTLSYFLNALYQQIPILFISYLYAPEYTGYLALAMQVIVVPNVLVSSALGDVFRQRAAADYNQYGRFDYIFKRTIRLSALLGILPYIALYFLAETLFAWYDESWQQTGHIASILSLALYFSFAITPIDKSATIVQNTRYILLWNTSFFLSHALNALLAYSLNWSIDAYLYGMVIVMNVHYLSQAFFSYKFSKPSQA